MILRLTLLWLLLTAPAAAQISLEAEARIDGAVAKFMSRERVPGIAVVALRGGKPLLEKAWGTGAVDGVQPIYSVSKHMTAALILDLARRRRVDLDAPVGRYLPQWFADEPALKLHHLLRQTSGLAEFTGLPEARQLQAAEPGTGSLGDMAALIDRQPRRFLPGSRHAYSNSNYTLLALVAERVEGMPFGSLLRARLFRPLGLAGIASCDTFDPARLAPGHRPDGATAVLPPNQHPTFAGNGGVCASAKELARWTRALGAGRVVGRGQLREMSRSDPVGAGYRPPYGFGLSLKLLEGRPALSHAGVEDGWGAWTAYLPKERLTLVVLADRGWLWTSDVALPILRALLDRPEPKPLERLSLTRSEREALSGQYEDGLVQTWLAAQGDRLLVSVPAFGEPIEMWKQPDGGFVSPAHPDTFSLRMGVAGAEFDWQEHRSYLVRTSGDPS
jgi:CubicO group peptidase (beta-lactamase class C family)